MAPECELDLRALQATLVRPVGPRGLLLSVGVAPVG